MNKQFPLNLALLACILALLAGCSRYELFDKAIAWERDSAGLTPHEITVGDLRIAYLSNTEARDGQVLVMIHGFAANKDNWVRMAGELTEHYQVYAIDLPGHGDSSKELDRDYRLQNQVEYLNRILSALELDQVNLIGNSMGGAITVLYSARYPDQVKNAVLFNPAGVFHYESELVSLVRDGSNPLIVSQPGDMERLVDFALEEKPFAPWPIYEVMEERAIANRAVNEKIFQALRDSGSEASFLDALATISAPVLIIWGDQDRVINFRNAEFFEQQIPVSEALVLEGIGHAPMIEVPERSATLVQSFIGDN
ncbi:alpha/beta fold hydrolase [Marinobacter zhejiangensis]|uniref:Pimeloyl-ACP methyl ester carboxylesterase n=1 Tax=Marinobacter zhejiangensis TaxID=488535 RepID=A0A1I4KYB6_9GAMM|nr:alpha/beta hydrolase [Marinobacter zhejiangensis]SFL83740.1 Pimeloyl-ACP methyl ester carboxylesterase [Marinobacter zhejiangensis]